MAAEQYYDGLRRHAMKKSLKQDARRRATVRRRAIKAYLIDHEHVMSDPVSQDFEL